jgi:membrane protein DedA with SNARE-associated domain
MLPVVRTFISLPAGIAEMPFGTFVTYTFAGCLPWVAALGAVGYVLGENWDSIVGSFQIASYAIAALIVVAAAVYLVRRRRRSNAV